VDVPVPFWLPDCNGPTGVMTLHCGRHADAYEKFVFLELSGARTREEAISTLAEIRRLLLNGDLPLNSVGVLP
jgi:hypothetical protein